MPTLFPLVSRISRLVSKQLGFSTVPPASPQEPPLPRALEWPQDEAALPWFDLDSAEHSIAERLEHGKIIATDSVLLNSWVRSGCFVIPNLIDSSRVRALAEIIQDLWSMSEPCDGLSISGICLGDKKQTISHAQLLSLSADERSASRARANWRVGGMHNHFSEARSIFEDPLLRHTCELILDRPATPRASLIFEKGSQQLLHQDTCAFHVYPRNNIVGVWIALEDISPDSGPLVYYPGSHREPLYSGFHNYPQTNRRTCDRSTLEQYDKDIDRLSQRYQRRQFLPRAGDAFFWHGQLIHGGDKVLNPSLTRLSYVIHFIADGCDVSDRVVGPYNW